MAERRSPIFTILAVAVLALSIVPVGTAAFVLGFLEGESPCVLCWEQRIGMALIALIGLFVLRYGPKPVYLGLAVLVGVWGIYMGVRHSGLHLARDIGQGFSAEILGAHTYTWSFFIFWCCTAAIAALMIMARREDLVPDAVRTLRPLEAAAYPVFLVVIAGNIVQAFASTGPPPFVGQSDPVRFTFNPRHWVWSLDEYRPAPVALRGRWSIPKPDVASQDADSGRGPFGSLPPMQIVETRRLQLPLRGTPTALDYDAATDRFLLTTQSGVYLTDGALSRVLCSTVVDVMFSVDLARFAGAAFLDSRTVTAVSENKSFVVLRESGGANPAANETRAATPGIERNFKYFLESFDDFDEVTRSRFSTVRARLAYIMAAAFDPVSKSLYTITIPNRTTRRLIVSRFDTADMTLSEEFVLSLAPGLPFAPADGAPGLERLHITGAAVADGRLYALSAAHSVLLTIDPAARAVVAARSIPGLSQPTGLAVQRGQFVIVSATGALTVVR